LLLFFRVAKLALPVTYENNGYYDITYTLLVWVAFLPTGITPGLFASWRMSRWVCMSVVSGTDLVTIPKSKSTNGTDN
jgi:hypothetical protein